MKKVMIQKLKGKPIVTYGLIVIQTIIFMIWFILELKLKKEGYYQQSEVIAGIVLGAESHELVVNLHQYWRVLTATFVHFGLMHYLMNTVFLYSIGSITEQLFGPWRYLCLYFFCALTGNILPLLLQPNTVIAGASGALFGLMGVWTIIWIKELHCPNTLLKEYGKQMFALAITNIVLNLFMDGVSILGHLGGFIGGLLFGLLMFYSFKLKNRKKSEY